MNDDRSDNANRRRNITARNLLLTRDVMESNDPPEEFLPKSCEPQTMMEEIPRLPSESEAHTTSSTTPTK